MDEQKLADPELEDEEEGADDSEESKIDAFLDQIAQEFERDKTADQDNRRLAYEDLEFAAGKQWEATDEETRRRDGRPCITQNHLGQIIKQVTNDLRINKPGISIKPVETDDRAEADIIEGLTRHIEYRSGAARVYGNWAEGSIECGQGHARLNIEEEDDGSGKKCLRIREIEDPLSVIWDGSSVRRDRSDARRCWVIDYLPRDLVDEEYPESIGDWPDETEHWQDWIDDYDEVRVCEVWKVVNVEIETYRVFDNETGEGVDIEVRNGEAPEGFDPATGQRLAKSRRREIRWWIVTAGKILDGGLEGNLWPGSRIPIAPCLGEEKRLGRKVVRKGMVRDAKDPQRLINWGLSLVVEAMAAAPKAKWVGPSKAFEGFEDKWENAHTSATAYLPYNGASPIPPQYNAPPIFPAGLVEAVGLFTEGLKKVTGIYDASLGARSNETSGKAIQQRERQGDVGTFHYIDNFIGALTNMAQMLVELIPIIYSDERKVRILGRDMQEKIVTINRLDEATGQWENRLNPAQYDVVVDSGPSFSTRRLEAAEGMKEFIQAFPPAAPLLGDLFAKMQDWPDADQVAMRMRALIPPQVLAMENNGGQMPPPEPPQPDPKIMADVAETQAKTEGQQINNQKSYLELVQMIGMLQHGIAPTPQPGMGNSAPNGQTSAGYRAN